MNQQILNNLSRAGLILSFAAAGTLWADTIVQATSASQQGATDTVAWSQLGADNTVLAASLGAKSAKGATYTVSFAGASSVTSVVCSASPCSWTASGFPAGHTLLWASDAGSGGNGPITIKAPAAVAALGALLQADAPGAFTAKIQLFNGGTSLGSITVPSDSAGDAVYVGAIDKSGANITSAVFSLTAGNGPLTDFAIDTLNITNSGGGGCNYSVSPTSANFGASAASGSVAVTAGSGCAWNATSNASWITITSGSSGAGNGTVDYKVAANTSSSTRSGTMTIAGQTVTVTQQGTGTGPSALRFIPVTPCRIADTRNANGPFGGPELNANSSREFVVPSSSCGIPGSAKAYSLNVTVVPSGSLEYLTIWPSGQSQPTASTLNSLDGRIKANASIVPAGTSGGVSIYVTDKTHVILDIDGYFVGASDSSALQFYPVAPCRVADTRNGTGPLGGPFLTAGKARAFPVLTSPCGLPSSAKAYSLNYTVIPKGPLGYLTTWPTGESQPTVSTLNAPTGTVTANAAIVPAGSSGDVSVFASDNTDLIIDVNGYFAAAGSGLSLYALTPCRVVDTRNPPGSKPFSGTKVVNVASSGCGAPASAHSFVLNATVVPPGSLQYITLWANGQSQPGVSTLNAYDGAITSNLALVPNSNGSVDAFASDPTQLILDISGYFAP